MSEQFSPKPTISADTLQRILDFRDERNWKQFHNPKDLAISLSLEAAELLECFQWSGEDTEVAGKTAAMKEELSDVAIYDLLLAYRLGLDLDAAGREKIQINAAKYQLKEGSVNSAKYDKHKQNTSTTVQSTNRHLRNLYH